MQFDILLKVAKRINELRQRRRRRHRDHARHRHDGGIRVLPEPDRQDRQAGRDGRLDAALHRRQRRRPAQPLQRRRRGRRSQSEGPGRAGCDERPDPRRALADQDQHDRGADVHVAAARPGRRRGLRQERFLHHAAVEAHDAVRVRRHAGHEAAARGHHLRLCRHVAGPDRRAVSTRAPRASSSPASATAT